MIIRGINKQIIFEDDQDKRKFIWTMKNCKDSSLNDIYGYCLMDNHIHLLIRESIGESVSEMIKRISSSYVFWYNLKYERCGHLFQERFRSETVESVQSLLRVLRYIHQNPLKAGLARDVFHCSWTSMHEYLHKGYIVDRDKILNLFSSDRKKAIALFKKYMNEGNEDQFLDIKIKVYDSEVLDYLNDLGITSSVLQKMDRNERMAVLADLKEMKGVSIRQISRITGISKSVIARI